MPSVAVLAGLILIVSFSMSHSTVAVEGTDWIEPVLLWISVCMPTGSGKSSLCMYLCKLVEDARSNSGLEENQPSWFLDFVSHPMSIHRPYYVQTYVKHYQNAIYQSAIPSLIFDFKCGS